MQGDRGRVLPAAPLSSTGVRGAVALQWHCCMWLVTASGSAASVAVAAVAAAAAHIHLQPPAPTQTPKLPALLLIAAA
jgi:hypothetical protein